MSSASSTYTAFNVTTTTAVFTPSTIIGLVLLVVLTVLAFGAILVTRVRRYRHRSQATRARLHHVKEAYFEVVDPASRDQSASFRSRLTGRFSCTSSREREPELPWPVYTVLPHLRPKAPLYARVLKAVMFWRRDEVKREPITVADLQRAIEQHAAAQARSTLSTGIGEEFKRTQSRRTSSSGCGRVDVPEIVIHPCDGSPAFSLVDEFTHPLVPCYIPSFDVQGLPSPENYSPASTASEPDSPMPATPASASAVFPAILSANSPLDTLEVPMPVTTAPKLAEEEVIVNVSSFSGKAFVLGRPPKKFVSATARGPRPVPPTASNVGLGICICSPGAAIVIREPCLPDRNGDSIKDAKDFVLTPSSSASSTSSVPNILSILDEVALDPPQPRAGSLSSRQQVRKKLPSISGSPGQPVRVFEAIKFESLSFESESAGFRPLPNSRSTYYGILDSYGCNGDGD
ncbi:hypothetical protein L226DRAFT_613884 [Lentinus tigrinus ALCF2SS1-7]|uniref:uncharacterized protein n=1 Tax=Lentinus tigrinus ALCF2SS1-7 TaxID=1328758 RepID=UPI001165DADC|nr:hypothetical protein L226DRAFT_613884 [Lentinus tigrinus ALCF2SS1-7]